MTSRGPTGPRPTDEELMQLYDGELAPERLEEVAEWVDHDEELAAKLDAMSNVGLLVRERVGEDDRADGVAAAVMAKLVDAPTPGREAEVIPFAGRRLRHYGQAEPANQNARSIFWLAGIAAAVAFGLFFWSRGGMHEASVATAPPANGSAVAEVEPGDSRLDPKWITAAPTAVAEHDEDPGPAVEVAAVDFGSHSGSVFYVSAGHSGAATTTAVVWVTEDVGSK